MYTPSQTTTEHSYFQAILAEKSAARLLEVKENPILIDEVADTFPKQLDFIKDKSRYKIACCSRRAGKSNGIARDMCETARGGWEHNVLYVSKTTDACKKIMWNLLLQLLAKRYRKNEYKTNASELSIYFPNTNSFIWLKGASDSTQIEKLRGLKLKKVYIDEAQSFPAYIGYLIDEILAPSLTDLQGTMGLCLTPNPTASGYAFDVWHQDTWSKHHWTIADNPFFLASAMKENPEITCIEDIIMSEARRRGVTVEDPAIQRDFYGRWVKSTELQVYKYTKEKQDFKELPLESMQVVLGIDLGFDDADSIVAVGFNKKEKVCYLIEEYKVTKSDITSLAVQIQRFVKDYSPYCCVIDAGALGKKISVELSVRHGLNLVAAEKERKAEFISLVNDDMRNGRIKIQAKTKTAQEMAVLCWDADYFAEGKFIEDPNLDNHLCDAFLYAFRWAYHYIYTDEPGNTLTYEQQDELNFIAKLENDKKIANGEIW